jgi:hypothetical protein
VILAALCVVAAASAVQGPAAADFFPLQKGTKWTYTETGVQNAVTTDLVVGEVEYAGQMATKVANLIGAREISNAYYKVERDGVYLLGYAEDDPLPQPLPIFKIGDRRVTWQVSGKTGTRVEASETFDQKGESQLRGMRDVLGTRVEVLEVKTTTVVGVSAARETIENTSIYGRGIGLVESTFKTTIGRRSTTRTIRLTAVERPKPADGN